MRFVLVTLGSKGDLHPYLAIGAELARRGHEVHLLGQGAYRAQVESEGIRFFAVVGQREHDRTLLHPDLWHPIRGLGVLWRHLFVPAVEPTFERLQTLFEASDTLLTVLAHPLAVGARFFRDKHPIRLLTGYTAPTSIRSVADPMFLGPWRVPAFIPYRFRQGLWKMLDQWKLEPMCIARLRRWQMMWGTPAIQGSVFGEWLHSPDGGIAMFPGSFQDRGFDWPDNVHQFDFPRLIPSAPTELHSELQDFLSSGEQPLLFYGGSAAAKSTSQAFEQLLTAANEQQLRTITVNPHAAATALHQCAPTGSRHLTVPWTDLQRLLPQTRAFVHHGGIGSCAEGLAAQVPQLIIASAFDQFQNGYCTERLGAGRWMRCSDVTQKSASEAIARIAHAEPRQLLPPGIGPKEATPGSSAVSAICDHLTR